MLFWTVVALLAVFPGVISYPGKGSRAFGGTTRIVNGRIALKNEIPYIVALGAAYDDPSKGYGALGCGGAIYNNNFIITAAHCFGLNAIPERYAVMAGGLNNEVCFKPENECGAQVIKLKRIISNEGYDDLGNYGDDIALLELEKPLVYNDGVQPIPIPPAGLVPKGKARVSGWGDTRKRLALSEDFEEAIPAAVLQTAEVEIVPRDKCDRIYMETKLVDVVFWSFKLDYHPTQSVPPPAMNLLCAVDTEGAGNHCHGDSGGPLQCVRQKADGGQEKYLCGIVSSGTGCGIQLPSAYTDVARFHDWILKHTKNGMN